MPALDPAAALATERDQRWIPALDPCAGSGGEKSTPKKKRLFKVKKAMQALEEALEEALNDRDRVMSVDECLKAVLALGNEGVAEFQQKLMLAVLKK